METAVDAPLRGKFYCWRCQAELPNCLALFGKLSAAGATASLNLNPRNWPKN